MLRVTSVLFLLLNFCLFEVAIASTRRVFEGDALQDNIRSFLVKLEFNRHDGLFDLCTGSLISWSWVITAAHCIHETRHRSISVVDDEPIGRRVIAEAIVRNVIKHPSYISPYAGKDIALMPLIKPISYLSEKKPIRLARIHPSFGPTAVIAGYGETEGTVSPPRQGVVTIQQCPDFRPDIICSKGSVRVGHGDSGGPLIFNGLLAGIISSTCTDATTNRMCLSMYASIAANIDWIQSVTNIQ